MISKIQIRIFAWCCTLVGIGLLIWQLKFSGPDWLLTAGVALMIAGWVLRAYAGYRPMRSRATTPRKPPSDTPL